MSLSYERIYFFCFRFFRWAVGQIFEVGSVPFPPLTVYQVRSSVCDLELPGNAHAVVTESLTS